MSTQIFLCNHSFSILKLFRFWFSVQNFFDPLSLFSFNEMCESVHVCVSISPAISTSREIKNKEPVIRIYGNGSDTPNKISFESTNSEFSSFQKEIKPELYQKKNRFSHFHNFTIYKNRPKNVFFPFVCVFSLNSITFTRI